MAAFDLISNDIFCHIFKAADGIFFLCRYIRPVSYTHLKGDKRLCVINETTGKEEENNKALWDKLRCGLSETAYDNTISIGQLKCATDGGMVSELRNYIANLNTSGSIALNITKASAYLKAQRKQLEARFVPEAAKSYTAALSEIRKIEQEISAPEYANHLTAKRQERGLVKEELDKKQKMCIRDSLPSAPVLHPFCRNQKNGPHYVVTFTMYNVRSSQ